MAPGMLAKPSVIYVSVQDRKNRKYKTLTVYGGSFAQVKSKVAKSLSKVRKTR